MEVKRTRLSVDWVGPISTIHLVTDDVAMTEVLASGRLSDTPDAPVELCLRAGFEGRFEVVDGHHRLAALMLRGDVVVDVVIHDYVDDEPYEGPYFNFDER